MRVEGGERGGVSRGRVVHSLLPSEEVCGDSIAKGVGQVIKHEIAESEAQASEVSTVRFR